MFRAYLSVNPRCPACDEDLSGERADDAPAFLTLLVGCLVGCAGVLLSDESSPQTSLLAVALFWLVVTAVASLLVLPRIQGRGRRLSMGAAHAWFRGRERECARTLTEEAVRSKAAEVCR